MENKTFELSKEQETAVIFSHEESNKSAVVTAAAGSGKTTLLVERIIRLLSDRKLNIAADSVAIMTFTKNATASMREKLNKALAKKLDALSDANTDNEIQQYEYLKKQMLDLRQATISTIDAFCFRMIKDTAEAFELPLNFRVADGAKKASMQAHAMRAALQDFYGGDFADEERDRLFYSFNFENDEALEEAVLSVYEKLSTHPDPEKWKSDTLDAYKDIDTVSERFLPLLSGFIKSSVHNAEMLFNEYSNRKIIESFEQECDTNIDVVTSKIKNIDKPDKKSRESLEKIAGYKKDTVAEMTAYIEYDRKRINALISDYNAYENAPSPKLLHTMIKNLSENSENEPKVDGNKAKSYEAKKLFNKTRAEVNAPIKDLLTLYTEAETDDTIISETRGAIKTFFDLLGLFTEYYTREKMAAGCIDFADCERELYNKLNENGGDNGFRKQLSERFSCIIVDEFQDSNKIQAEIFRLLGEGHLFYVGDVKQSIYAFRGADPYIMADMCKPENEEFETLPLNMNFRSRRAVINAVNDAFDGLMTSEYGGVEYSGEKLVKGCKLPEFETEGQKELFNTEIFLVPGAGESDSDDDDDKNMKMPLFVARKIKELHDNKDFLVAVDDDDKEKYNNATVRPAEYSDFIILMRSKTKIDYYRKALLKYGIPSVAPKGSYFFEADEVLLAYNYLKVIDNPMLNEEMLKVLMSPIYRFTVEDVARLKMGIVGVKDKNEKKLKVVADAHRSRSLYSCIIDCMKRAEENGADLTDPTLTKLVQFYGNFKELRYYMNTNSLDNLVRKVYEVTDLISVVAAFEDSAGRVENIRQLQRLAADFEADRGGGLGDFLRFFDRAKDNASKGIEEAARPESSANAVRIMTFHGSKGLEAPVCIMTELNKAMSSMDYSGNLLMSFEHFMAIKHTDIKLRRKTKTVPYLAISRFIKDRQLGDELRLLYVAMTRAQEKLIMVSSLSNEESKDFGKFIENNTVHTDPDLKSMIYENRVPFKCVLSMLLVRKKSVDSKEQVCLIEKTDAEKDEDNGVYCKISVAGSVKDDEETKNTNDGDEVKPIVSKEEVRIITLRMNEEYGHLKDTAQQAKYTTTELAHKKSVKPISLTRPSFARSGEVSGVEKGNAYHHCMMYFPIERMSVGMKYNEAVSTIETILDELTGDRKLTEDERGIVEAERIAKFFTCELGQRMIAVYHKAPESVKREQSFYAEISGGEVGLEYDGNISIQGQVDMYFIEEGKITVVDYKSDTVKNLEKEMDSYELQVKIYNMILKKLTGLDVGGMYLYAFLADEAMKIK